MKLQILAAILLVTILSPKRSSEQLLGAQDHETPFEEAVGVFLHPAGGGFAPVFLHPAGGGLAPVFLHPAGGGLAPVFRKPPAGKGFPREFMNQAPRFVGVLNGAMICGLRIRNY
ncbi:unnamed protein product [Natator depressus]